MSRMRFFSLALRDCHEPPSGFSSCPQASAEHYRVKSPLVSPGCSSLSQPA